MPYIPRIQSIINKADACSAGSKKAGLVYGSDFTRVPYNILKSRTPTNILFSATTGNCCSGNNSEYNNNDSDRGHSDRGNSNVNDSSTIYSPSFTQDYSTGCSSGAPIINGNTITFRPGRVRSVESYKNISKITATVDLNGMTNINWINASFYIIQNNKDDEYCDSGNSGNPFCNEIDFLETNGNIVTQSTIHLGGSQNAQYAYTTPNSCWNSNKLSSANGTIDITDIDPASPFNIIAEFDDEYTNMTVTYKQGEISKLVYDFKNNTVGDGSNLTSLSNLKSAMANEWRIVASLWQGYSPNPGDSYDYTNCTNWSDMCEDGPSYTISNIQVTAD
jgi:hypothetical protein